MCVGFVVWSISLCKLFLEEFSHHVFGISTDFDRVEACFTCMMSHVQVVRSSLSRQAHSQQYVAREQRNLA